jgi:glycosyltransferase involved in cell wall biosynthesis
MNQPALSQPLISVVIPLYCEGPHVSRVLAELQRELEPLKCSYEIILVDDGSPDDTWAIVQEQSEKYPMLRALSLSRNFGKESALGAGIETARGAAVIVMDGDLQHPPSLIPQMVKEWRESNADIVEAVKVKRGHESLADKIGAKIFYTLLNKLSGYDLTGATDFKLLDRRVVDAWLEMGERSLFFRGMTAWLGFKRIRIPFAVPKRVGGESKWPIIRLIKLALTGITAFSSVPLQLISFAGAGFLVFAIGLGGQTLYLKVTGVAVSGFTTVILLLLIIGSALMIGLGIIGEYLSRIYEEVKRRPRYVVAKFIDRISSGKTI